MAPQASMIGTSMVSESEFLDFKSADRIEIKADGLKAIWSVALRGFAYSDRGVLIWGIDAPKMFHID